MEALPDRYRLRRLERLWAVPYGPDESVGGLPSPTALGPREALEHVALAALRRPPCLVSFSGGCDSSAVLAVAAHVARREGLPLPIPATNRFPGLEEADETGWQERVVDHLGLDDWIRLDWTDELEILGPYGTELLRRHGVLVPFNAHFHAPVFELARGGALLTGVGGDEAFEPPSRTLAALALHRHRRTPRRRLPRLAFELAPGPVRALVEGADMRRFAPFHWIRPSRRLAISLGYASWAAREPTAAAGSVRWWWRNRTLQCNLAAKRVLALAHDVHAAHPFADELFLAALARGRAGLWPRRRALHALLGDLLPADVIDRQSKAGFNGAFWGSRSRAFAAAWAGEGVDSDDVDAERLRAEWAKPEPDPHSFALLQHAWLARSALGAQVERQGAGDLG
jgi:asparagine synthetase B (glutamine-hydrolysing)